MTRAMLVLRRTLEVVTAALVALITILVTLEVLLRGFFDISLIVVDEGSRYLMIWIVMLAGGLVSLTDEHIRIELIPRRASFALRKALRIASQILVMVFLVVLIAASLTILPGMRGDRTITLGISMYPVYLALPVGGGLMLLVTAWNTWRIVGARTDEDLALRGDAT
ncbi:MAG: TRAP transporter small permease [Burkholderiales bacterium]|jgi:TRAP-type C4-dicarboxylate transport system permease small subunit|nr:TRAP transporter small permease [Burkholderiales bacterium]